jgi:CBS domain containing-hemolysin-like protein
LRPDGKTWSIEKHRKEGYFREGAKVVEKAEEEIELQGNMFNQLKEVRDVQKKIIIQWMNLRINECNNEKKVVVPRISLRHHVAVDRGLGTLVRSFETASSYEDTLCA